MHSLGVAGCDVKSNFLDPTKFATKNHAFCIGWENPTLRCAPQGEILQIESAIVRSMHKKNRSFSSTVAGVTWVGWRSAAAFEPPGALHQPLGHHPLWEGLEQASSPHWVVQHLCFDLKFGLGVKNLHPSWPLNCQISAESKIMNFLGVSPCWPFGPAIQGKHSMCSFTIVLITQQHQLQPLSLDIVPTVNVANCRFRLHLQHGPRHLLLAREDAHSGGPTT